MQTAPTAPEVDHTPAQLGTRESRRTLQQVPESWGVGHHS